MCVQNDKNKHPQEFCHKRSMCVSFVNMANVPVVSQLHPNLAKQASIHLFPVSLSYEPSVVLGTDGILYKASKWEIQGGYGG